jgi:hypothetical protein
MVASSQAVLNEFVADAVMTGRLVYLVAHGQLGAVKVGVSDPGECG